jgi:superfamily II DNA or RNA helicase
LNIEGFIRSSASFSNFFEKAKELTNKERGDAFERVVQLHLQSKPKYASELDAVWQLHEVPKDVRKYLNLPEADEGIDLIAKHVGGTYWAIQAKYRGTPNDTLKWAEKGGLSTFTSLAFTTCENIAYGLVVSTTNRPLKKTHLTGKNVGFELYGDLLELDDDDGEGWKLLKTGLKGKPKPPKKYTPLPHQRRAINNAQKHFVKEDNARGKLIMPCGTGKSLTGFWIAKELDAKEIVVAVPSLALIKQTLNTWTREYLAHGIKPKWMAVCSDSSAGEIDAKEDRFTAELYDVGVPCVTDPKIIKKFLNEKSDQPRIIFTTYQSGQVLAKAAKSIKHTFDLGIMDEAHKTVGRKDKVFAHLVDQKNIKINRRVFMTATERFYRGNSQEIISMDDPDTYGDTFELLTFKQAIEVDNIICDYRFVTIGIAQSEITALWENNDYLRVEGTELDEDTTRSLASGLALRKAYAELGVKRAISFHKSIKLASRFKEQQEQLAEAFPELTKVDCFHVSSKTSTGERNVQLRDFADADRGLITNARCLTEGVDIPSVDCVLFADPRQSKVDIVQAAGRAMRKSEETGKKHGFIIVPLVVPDELDLETFADTTAFANVVTIIKALAAEDERIVEYLRVISTGKTTDVGERVETDFTEVLAEKVDAAVFLENLKLKVWDKVAKLNWKPFEDARDFVHSLKLENEYEWRKYSKSCNKPADIPAIPHSVYTNDWVGYGDWLGTGRVAPKDYDYLSFEEAREIVVSCKFASNIEFKTWVSNRQEMDVPSHPDRVYSDSGWINWPHWIGGDERKANRKGQWRPYKEARDFVRSRGFVSASDHMRWTKTGDRPLDIPSVPSRSYKEAGWISWQDYLGPQYNGPKEFADFETARDIVRGFNLGTHRDFVDWTKSPAYQDSIPIAADRNYRDTGWKSWPDFLGTEPRSPKRGWRDFYEAKQFVQTMGFNTSRAYRDWASSPESPSEIPVSADSVYRGRGWKSWPDFLGMELSVVMQMEHRAGHI